MSVKSLKNLSSLKECSPKGFYPDMVYVNTNESDLRIIQEQLISTEKIGNLYIGVSGLYNFNIASIRDLESILIFDASPTVKFFYKNIIKIIKKNSRNETLKEIERFIKNNETILFKVEGEDNISSNAIRILNEEIKENLSFLSSDERFMKIKNIILNNQFLFVNLDIYKEGSFDDLVDKLTENNLTIDTLYLSNLDLDIIKKINFKFISSLKGANIISAGDFCMQRLTKIDV
ncbi:MAG: hypothetical protein K940chlam1_01271 [Candidatus Anoxychlamydiales bacterium]|nr:hypothetical protein [Candidatus Anoxychlamydiales bacterium]NGX35318.1 hypothetical protein [Candidatus Anoxychlamydiales bacterium]